MSISIRNHCLFYLFTGIIALLFSCKQTTPITKETREVRTPVTIGHITIKSVNSEIDLTAVSRFMNKNIVRASTAGTIEMISVRLGDFAVPGQVICTIRTRESMAMDHTTGSDSTLFFRGLISIVSQSAGVISSISYQKGDFVQEGDEIAIISVQNSLVFILEVPFEYESYTAKNKRCKIALPDERKIDGTITGKLPEMEMQTQTVSYVIKPLTSEKLPGNLIARVSLIRSVNDKAIVLPKEAVLGNETQTDFWVMKLINDSTAVRVKILKGYENNDEIEITEPIFQGADRIVLTGNYGLPDTAGIKIISE
jgi:biotin carboxyl carrier protein